MKAIYHNKKEREYEKNNHDYLSDSKYGMDFRMYFWSRRR
jgi:hypothetical protein